MRGRTRSLSQCWKRPPPLWVFSNVLTGLGRNAKSILISTLTQDHICSEQLGAMRGCLPLDTQPACQLCEKLGFPLCEHSSWVCKLRDDVFAMSLWNWAGMKTNTNQREVLDAFDVSNQVFGHRPRSLVSSAGICETVTGWLVSLRGGRKSRLCSFWCTDGRLAEREEDNGHLWASFPTHQPLVQGSVISFLGNTDRNRM